MIPTNIDTIILLPGLPVGKPSRKKKLFTPQVLSLCDAYEGGILGKFYSPRLGKVIEDGEELVKNNKLNEILFAVTNITELNSPPWMVEYMEGIGFSDLEANAQDLYDVARSRFSIDLTSRERVHYISFLGLWAVDQSTDFWSGYSEIDSIDFAGVGKVILSEEKP